MSANKHRFNRRKLLKGMALGGGAVTFGGLGGLSQLAQASNQAGPPRHYIFCYFSGGWDILLSLDPRDPGLFRTDNISDTLINPGYGELANPPNAGDPIEAGDLVFGPYIGRLAEHVDRLAVVRGMSMETLTHEAGRRRFITGKPPSGLLARGSSVATWLAGSLGADQLIPNLSVRVESYNVDFPPYASALNVASVPDLLRALQAGDDRLAAEQQELVSRFLADHSTCPSAVKSPFWSKAEEARVKSNEMIANGLDGLFDFAGNAPEAVAARQRYQISTARLGDPNVRAAAAVAAITGGVSRAVSIEIASGLDTHFDDWTRDQGPRQQAGFDLVASMVEDLAERTYPDGSGRSWLDVTTIVGFSEFSRTALLNANTGRDHSLTNACFLIGGGIGGNRVIGASADVGMAPLSVDLSTGQRSSSGEVIHPEHIMQTLMVEAGMDTDPADLRVDPVPALLA